MSTERVEISRQVRECLAKKVVFEQRLVEMKELIMGISI